MNNEGATVLVNVILDRSGSMGTTRDATISGYNEYLKALREDKDTKYFVSLTQFDAPMNAPELTVSYLDTELEKVQDLTRDKYEPRGNTPLYDAIGETIRRVEAKGRTVITVIITDGLENASQEFNRDTIKALISEKEKEGWTFTFLGANIDSYAVGATLGVAAANTSNYTPQHTAAMYRSVGRATMARASAVRSMGLRAASAKPFLTNADRAAMTGDTHEQKQTTGASKRSWKTTDSK